MTMTLTEYVNCEICGFDDTELLYEVPEITGLYCDVFNLVRCKNCDLVYVNPRPTIQAIRKYYSPDTYYAYQNYHAKDTSRHRTKTLLMEMAGGYIHTNRIFSRIIKLLTNNILIGLISYKENGTLLDIGCGNGTYIKWLQDQGWNVQGIETNKKAIRICKDKGLKVFAGELTAINFPNETFNVVTLIQVLEHFHNPSATLKEIHRILKQDGVLLIGVPNFGCFDRKFFRRDWTPVEVPRHLYHFELTTIMKLLRINSFDIREVRAKGFYLFGIKNLGVLKKQGIPNFLKGILLVAILKPILLIFSRYCNERFATLTSFYCQKLSQ